jgi:hypothetical protein
MKNSSFTACQEIRERPFLSFRRTPESRNAKPYWTPAFAGVTIWRTFGEIIRSSESFVPQNPLENEDDLSYSPPRIPLGREMIL